MSTTSTPAEAPAAAAQKTSPARERLRHLASGTGGPFLGLLALCIALFIASPYFLTVNNLLNILDQVTILGILALGMTFVIVTGGIDLSVGAILALSMMVLGWTSHNAGWPLWLSIVAAIVVGGLCGLTNGLGITLTKLPPFIATLAMLSIARGLANVITDGQQIVGYPDGFTALSTQRYFGFLTDHRRGADPAARRRVGVHALPARRPGPVRDRRQRGGRPPRRHPGQEARPPGSTSSPGSSPGWPASCSPPGWTPPSPAPRWGSSSTPSRPSSSAARACPAASGASPAP